MSTDSDFVPWLVTVMSTDSPNTTSTAAPPQRHLDALKCLLLAALLALCFVFSIIPFTLRKLAIESTPDARRQTYALVFTLLSCYGGGVFLGTCLLDLLPDGITYIAQASESIPQLKHETFPLSEFLVALGFFIVLFTEQLIMWMKEQGYFGSGRNSDSANMMESVEEAAVFSISTRRSTITQLPTLTERDQSAFTTSGQFIAYDQQYADDNSDEDTVQQRDGSGASSVVPHDPVPEISINDDSNHQNSPCDHHHNHEHEHDDHQRQPVQHQGHDHDLHFDPGTHSTVRAMLLVCALSLHSIFEGLALGLTPSVDEALSLFAALAIHKSLIAFSVGLRLVQSSLSTLAVWGSCLTFCVMAPLGGFVGVALIEEVHGVGAQLLSGCLTSVACGTFLYVTCFEILPHELNEGSHKMAKLCAMVLGFVTICLMVILT